MSNPSALNEQKITKALEPSRSLEESLNILMEADIKSGQAVALLDGGPYALDGVKGVVKGSTDGKSGFVDVQLPNGMVVPVPANLLIPV